MNLLQQFEDVEDEGKRARAWKNRLMPLMAWMPMTANQQTLTRGCILFAVNLQIFHGDFDGLLPWFIGAWLLDLTDGLTAQYWSTAGQGLGRYLDPMIDIPISLMTAYVLWPQYQHGHLMTCFFALSIVRGLVCLLYLGWATWVKAPRIVPPNVASQTKTWFLAASFGLLIASRSPTVIIWAECALAIGLLFEFFGIISLARDCYRRRKEWMHDHPNESHCPSSIDHIE